MLYLVVDSESPNEDGQRVESQKVVHCIERHPLFVCPCATGHGVENLENPNRPGHLVRSPNISFIFYWNVVASLSLPKMSRADMDISSLCQGIAWSFCRWDWSKGLLGDWWCDVLLFALQAKAKRWYLGATGFYIQSSWFAQEYGRKIAFPKKLSPGWNVKIVLEVEEGTMWDHGSFC